MRRHGMFRNGDTRGRFLGLPYCLVYRVAWLTFEVGRRVVDVDCLGIINILTTTDKSAGRLPTASSTGTSRDS